MSSEQDLFSTVSSIHKMGIPVKTRKSPVRLTKYRKAKYINDWLSGMPIKAVSVKYGYASPTCVRRVIHEFLEKNPAPVRAKWMSDAEYKNRLDAWKSKMIPVNAIKTTKYIKDYIYDSVPIIEHGTVAVEEKKTGFFESILKVLGFKK